jgi:prepilin-type processing-associated H-X9-DG protein/prepilin-type N-terminal cleavage/methylation domain-containing protein
MWHQLLCGRATASGNPLMPIPRRGLTLIELVVVLAIIALLTGLILAGVQRLRTAAGRTQCANTLRQLGLALHSYHDNRGLLPPGMSLEKGHAAEPYLSWLARLLPYLEQAAVWREVEEAYRQDKNFLSSIHVARAWTIRSFLCPSDGRIGSAASLDVTGHLVAYTSYLGVVGRNAGICDGLLYMDSRHKLTDASDGASATVLIGERPPSSNLDLGWWYAGWGQAKNGDAEFLLGVRTRCYNQYLGVCREGPYHFTPGSFANPCDAFHFWSPHPGGANFAFADGSVRFLRYSADAILPALATRAGGEAVELPD